MSKSESININLSEQLKILVVDDMPTMRKVVIHMLNELNLKNVSQAEDGQEAWSKIVEAHKASSPYELIISDVNMPKMNGIELLEKVRTTEAFKTLPFLIVTVEDQTYTVMKAVQLGVSNYIVKPFSPSTLKDKIERVFAKEK